MQFQIPHVRVMFYSSTDCDRCSGQVALGMQHRKSRTTRISHEWTEISCKAEMLCLGQARAELLSANELGFCAAVVQQWHPCTAVWKHLLPHLLYKPFGNRLTETESQSIKQTNKNNFWVWSFRVRRNIYDFYPSMCLLVMFWTFHAPCPRPYHCGTDIVVVNM